MEQNTNSEKIKSTKTIIISVATVLFSVFVVIGILIYVFLHSFSGANKQKELSKYNNKIYSVSSDDGKVQGFIATKVMSCGEFPSDLCLHVLSNIFIKEPIPIEKGRLQIGNVIQNEGNFFPVECDNVNMDKIIPIWVYNQADCIGEKSNNIKSMYVSADSPIDSYLADNLQAVNEIKIYDSNINSKSVKTYQVKVQTFSLPENKYISLAKCREKGGNWSESKCREGGNNIGIIEDTYHCNCICCK
ncbi:MAG: hypothetical protein WC608_02245 [Parcubacteria group bacterium]